MVQLDPWWFVPVAKLAWALRLWQLGLVRHWPWLFGYLCGSALLGTVTAVTIATYGWNSVASLWVLPAARVMHYFAAICVAFEAFRNADLAKFHHHSPGYLVPNFVGGYRAGNVALMLFAGLALVAYRWGPWAAGTFWIRVEPLACFYVAAACVVCGWGVRSAE